MTHYIPLVEVITPDYAYWNPLVKEPCATAAEAENTIARYLAAKRGEANGLPGFRVGPPGRTKINTGESTMSRITIAAAALVAAIGTAQAQQQHPAVAGAAAVGERITAREYTPQKVPTSRETHQPENPIGVPQLEPVAPLIGVLRAKPGPSALAPDDPTRRTRPWPPALGAE